MNTPLFPNGHDEQDRQEAPEAKRWLTAHPDALRIAAGAIAVVGALVGLVSRLEGSHPASQAAPVVIQRAVYGRPNLAALHAADGLTATRRVCTGEIRPNPDRGAWRCNSIRDLDFNEIGVQAVDPGGPCTHRETSERRTWRCITTIAIPKAALGVPHGIPWFFGDLRESDDVAESGRPGICWMETRANPNSGPWKCMGWRPLNPAIREIQAVDPGGPCAWREVDQPTGIWTCVSQ